MNSIAPLSYGLACIAYSVLTVVLLIKRKKQWQWSLFFLSALISAVWAFSLTSISVIAYSPLLEVLRSSAWILFMLMLMHPSKSAAANAELRTKWRSRLRIKPYALGIAGYLMALLIATLLVDSGRLPALAVSVNITGRVILAIIGMLMVEHVFRNASKHDRWSLKFACLALASIFVCDFYLYSDAMLFHLVNGQIFAGRGFVNALLLPLFIISLNRDLKWMAGIGVSRRVLFHSAALIGASAYLLIMAAAGYYLRYVGGQWGTVLQMSFLFGAGILLIVLLFSGTVRAWLRVFISKHFYRYNYDYREEWIRLTRVLSANGPGPDLGERIIEAVAELVESGAGTLFVRRESGGQDTLETSAQWNTTVECQPIQGDSAMCELLQNKNWVIDLEEYRRFPARYHYTAIDLQLLNYPQAWLLIPLVFQGRLFGIILLEQPRSRVELNWEILDVLKIAASQAVSYLAQQENAHALLIARQFESFNRMSTFMVHDLKNMVTQLSLMLINAEKHRHNPAFQKDMLETVDNSVQKMKTLLQKLDRGHAPEHMSAVDMALLLQRVIESKTPYEPRPVLDIVEQGITVYANMERIERVIGHIVQNAIDATPRLGDVKLKLRKRGRQVELEVIDSGHGMSEEFIRDKLFAPFVSTKAAGMGIGVFETREYLQQLGGKLEVVSSPLAGTSFKMIFPAFNNQEQPGRQVA